MKNFQTFVIIIICALAFLSYANTSKNINSLEVKITKLSVAIDKLQEDLDHCNSNVRNCNTDKNNINELHKQCLEQLIDDDYFISDCIEKGLIK